MTGFGSIAKQVAGAIIFGAAVALPQISPAKADCANWDVSGRWRLEQMNGYWVTLDINQTGNRFVGKAESETKASDPAILVTKGQLEGSVTGNSISFVTHWEYGSGVGEYTGSISPEGWLAGDTRNMQHPELGATHWASIDNRQAKCLDVVAAPPGPGSDFAAFCNRYADDAVAQATKNKQEKCGLEKDNPDRWTLNRDDHLNWCLGQEGAYSGPTTEGGYRIAGLNDCAEKQKAMKEKLKQEAMTGKEALTPGPKIGDLLKDTGGGGGGAEYATAIVPATIYEKPGGAALKDANGDDAAMAVGSKALVLAKQTNPVWYKVQTKPVGWVWGEDVTLGP